MEEEGLCVIYFLHMKAVKDGQVYLFQLLLNIHMLVSRFGLFHFYSNETGSLTDECDLLGKYIMKIVVYQGDDFDELVSQ